MDQTVMPTIPNNVWTLRDVLAQMYQILGAEDVPATVLDVVSAAMNGEAIPNVDIIPYESKAQRELEKLRSINAALTLENAQLTMQLKSANSIKNAAQDELANIKASLRNASNH